MAIRFLLLITIFFNFLSFNKSNVTIIVKEFTDLYYYKYYDVFKKQWDMDHIKHMRSPELFILWYNK